MRAFSVFRKTLREMSREAWLLGLTIAFAPFFVLLYYLITAGGLINYAKEKIAKNPPKCQ